jgi:hypothetical protein
VWSGYKAFSLTELARQYKNFWGLSGGMNTSLRKGGNQGNVEEDIKRTKEEIMGLLRRSPGTLTVYRRFTWPVHSKSGRHDNEVKL